MVLSVATTVDASVKPATELLCQAVAVTVFLYAPVVSAATQQLVADQPLVSVSKVGLERSRALHAWFVTC